MLQIHSWQIADKLLQEKHDLHSCYFAAQTMRNKIQNSFDELPVASHESLRDSLLEHISHITEETNPTIVTQLCLALADLILLMSSWRNPIACLMERFASNSNSTTALIVILTLIPEEINSRFLRLGANRREEIMNELTMSARRVLEFLQASLMGHQQAEKLHSKIIKCFTSWLSINVFRLDEVVENMVLSYAFNLIGNHCTDSNLHETAADCLCALLTCLETNNNSSEVEHKIFTGISGLGDAYHMSVAHEDIDKAINFARVFTVMGESFMHQMIASSCGTTPHYSIRSLDLVLNCVGHYDFEVAEITFNMFFKLSEDLYNRNNDTLTSHFKPYIERLIHALFKHCQMEADYEGLLEEGEAFKDFRERVAELIKDVIFIVSSSSCFKQMFMILQQANVTWESTEAALFIMETVARNILPDENEVVPKVVEAILNLPESCHIAIRYTSINILGELCDWIECHPESLQPIISFLLYALQQKNGIATAAANGMHLICSSSRDHLMTQITGLMEIARHIDNFDIEYDASINMLKGIAGVVGRLPHDQCSATMTELCSYQSGPLLRLIESDTKLVRNERSDPAFWLDRLAAVYRFVNVPPSKRESHPCLPALSADFPTLSRCMDKYQQDTKIIERVVRCLRYILRCIGSQSSPILESLVKQMVMVYANHQHSCLLYLGSILVDEFGTEDAFIGGLLNMLQAFIEPTFNRLQQENGLKNNPDTVDDFFRLARRFVLRRPLDFLKSPLVTPIIQCALLASTLDHREANASVMSFFSTCLGAGRATSLEDKHPELKALVEQLLVANGEALVVNLIYASIFCLHSYMLTDVVDVFHEIKAIDSQSLQRFLQAAINALPKKNSGGSVTATDTQLTDFMNRVMR